MLELLLLALVGAGAGVMSGLLGFAGGIVVVPALTWIYGPSVLQTAITVSWFAVLFNSLGAVSKQLRVRTAEERRQLWRTARWFLLGTVVITPIVAVLSLEVKGVISPFKIGVMQLCMAAMMLWPLAESAQRLTRQRPMLDASIGGVVGAMSTLIGVGGGSYTIAYFVYGAGSRFRDAIATANLTGLTVGALSVLGYLSTLVFFKHPEAVAGTGPISTWGMVVLVVAGTAAAPLGVKWSTRLPTKTLRQTLIFALLISAGRLLWS